MTRRLLCFTVSAFTLAAGVFCARTSDAQTQAILAEVYGRGVHAYNSGRYDEAETLLTTAIDGGTKDPRAYYFRGIVSMRLGLETEAESDWKQGAEIEAQSGDPVSIGRALARFQGSPRLKLEGIRQTARLKAMMTAQSRSNQRRSQLGLTPSNAASAAMPKAAPPVATPAPAAPAATDPFADDAGMAQGQPRVESDNALKGLDDNPFKDDPVAGAAAAAPAASDAPAGNDPFANPGAKDPFAQPAGGNDPFAQ
ncbi:MAG: hypothetical protein AAGJ83_02880, partial [Planctomycetota bacterium]